MSGKSLVLDVPADDGSLEAVRSRPWGDLWVIPWEELSKRRLMVDSAIADDTWIIPRAWASAGRQRELGSRSLHFHTALPGDWSRSDPRSEEVLRRLKRMALATFVMSVRPANSRYHALKAPPKPSTWAIHMRSLMRLARRTLEISPPTEANSSTCPERFAIFQHLSPEVLLAQLEAEPHARRTIVPRFNSFFEHGVFDDWPANDVDSGERWQGEAFRPFTDEFLTEIGQLACWMTDELAPLAIEATAHFPQDESKKKRAARYRGWAAAAAVTPLKFTIMVRGEATQVEELSSWPPSRWAGVRDSVHTLQSAHAAILFLALGLRVSELVELRRDCLIDADNGPVLSGATFKLSQQRSGRAREWPLPEIAVRAIRRQLEISEFLRPNSDYLFVTSLGENEGVFTAGFRQLVKAERNGRPVLSLCDGNPHPHRFRKSVARLAALTLMGAGQILYEVFGHKDPEMTLSYMLSDPDLQAEIRVVAQEVSIALASEAVLGADENGGPAAPAFKAMVDRLVPRVAGAEMGSEDIRRAARVLSRDGAQVLLVRENILCTKTTNQAGPCTRVAGAPDVGRCDAACGHRLELAAAKQDHIAAIEQILSAFDETEELQRAWWAAQLRTHLISFEEVRATYEGDPRARAILKFGEPLA